MKRIPRSPILIPLGRNTGEHSKANSGIRPQASPRCWMAIGSAHTYSREHAWQCDGSRWHWDVGRRPESRARGVGAGRGSWAQVTSVGRMSRVDGAGRERGSWARVAGRRSRGRIAGSDVRLRISTPQSSPCGAAVWQERESPLVPVTSPLRLRDSSGHGNCCSMIRIRTQSRNQTTRGETEAHISRHA